MQLGGALLALRGAAARPSCGAGRGRGAAKRARACGDLASPSQNAADSFGAAFGIVRNDISNNIDRIRTRKAADPERFRLLYPIVEDEVARHDDGHGSSCTKGLLWLKRWARAGARGL